MSRWSMFLALILVVPLATELTGAVFSGTARSNTNAFTAAASFPTYPQSVATDGPYFQYRLEESSGTTVTDSSVNNRPGTYAGATNGMATWYQLEENAGTTLADSTGAANTATAAGGPTWVAGKYGRGLRFDGVDDYATGTRSAVRTNASFSVAAWVNLTGTGTVLSQSGSAEAGFALTVDPGGKWALAFTAADTSGSAITSALSAAVATTGSWVHVVGVYDQATGNATVYVNGTAGTPVAVGPRWDATGTLQIGRSLRSGAYGSRLNGAVDDLRVYPTALSAAAVTALTATGATLRYEMDENAGATTADTSGSGNTGTLGGGVAWTASGHSGPALSFDGVDDYVQSASPAIDATGSFSVSAWVYLTTAGWGSKYAAVSQSATFASTFQLYITDYSWAFGTYYGDVNHISSGNGASVTMSVADPTNAWVHLVGVHDSGSGTNYLYVNGVQGGTLSAPTSVAATGPVQIGRGKWMSAFTEHWPGRIDQVQTFGYALSAADVTGLYNTGSVTVTSAPATVGLRGALDGPQQGLAAGTAVAFHGNGHAYQNATVTNPTTFSLECWFRVGTGRGGLLIGLQDTATGASGGEKDRSLYVDSGGRISFAVYTGSWVAVRSPLSYTDGNWHHVVATLSPAGMVLYLDGSMVASSATSTARNATGYWHIGGGDLTGLPNRPAGDYLSGTLDEVAVYPTALSAQQVLWHFHADH